MGDLFNTFLSSIKYQFSRFLTKFRTLTSKTYLKNKVWGKIKLFFAKLFDVKPKHKNDYYTIFNWLVSKRLAYLVVIVIGIVSFSFLYNNRANFFHVDDSAVKSYNYSSILLRFAKGNVRIKGKGGYLAYEGNVSKGYVNGKGRLFNHDEQLLYDGEFNYNAFNGRGLLYYSNGNLRYEGDFANNLYEGEGTEYRETGVIAYRGEFKKGLKDGTGTLFDAGGSEVYTGAFQADSLVYSALIGKDTQEVASVYSGNRVLYEGDNCFDVYMQDIDAIYEGAQNEDALDDAIRVKSVYVLKNYFPTGKGDLTTRQEIMDYFGDPLYAGESNVTQSEALAIAELRKTHGDSCFENAGLTTEEVYNDDLQITGFDNNMIVYIESYQYGDLEYTFVSRGSSSENFGFYYISQ